MTVARRFKWWGVAARSPRRPDFPCLASLAEGLPRENPLELTHLLPRSHQSLKIVYGAQLELDPPPPRASFPNILVGQ